MNTMILSGLFLSKNYLRTIGKLLTDFEQSLLPYKTTSSEMYDTINMLDGCFFE